jgi:TonB-dependent Receptor Plug Domain
MISNRKATVVFLSLCAALPLAIAPHGALSQTNPSSAKTNIQLETTIPMPCPGASCREPGWTAKSTAGETEFGRMPEVATVRTAITVVAESEEAGKNEGYVRRIDPKEIESSAGTFGDLPRFMQMLPGVASDNDKFNDFVVRGGNPSETLFIVDNIEIPSINQLALSDTTGGFVSMIDNAAIRGVNLHTDAYDSKFDQRLSAIVEISTQKGETVPHTEFEVGIAGAGSSISRPWGTDGSVFLSARQSILQLFTDDIGFNGVPVYSNFLFRADKSLDAKNSLWGLSLAGIDSMNIHPDPLDLHETNAYDINYKGWRNTTGIGWQHLYSMRSFGVVTLSNSEQSQSVQDNAQMLKNATVYSEDTSDGVTTAKYDWLLQAKSWLTITAGVRASVDRLNYDVQQPLGLQNPYSANAAPTNAMSLHRTFSTGSVAEYSQAAVSFPHGMKLIVGQRFSDWAIVGASTWTPKVLFMLPVFGKMAHVGYAEYAQLPPSLYLLSFSNRLKPIRSEHVTGGIDLIHSHTTSLSVEAYQKRYMDYPVATNFPQLSLANIADTFGQAFLMFPMTSKGSGLARGVELSLNCSPVSRFTLTTAVTYSRSWYSGLDGILRRGNFDLPLMANISGVVRVKGSLGFSFRYSAASGKLYTPDNAALSLRQAREVYDLSMVNGLRAPVYSRLDFRVQQSHPIGRGVFTWHVGLDNALGTKNFYSYEWEQRARKGGSAVQDQLPRFPDGGVKFSF